MIGMIGHNGLNGLNTSAKLLIVLSSLLVGCGSKAMLAVSPTSAPVTLASQGDINSGASPVLESFLCGSRRFLGEKTEVCDARGTRRRVVVWAEAIAFDQDADLAFLTVSEQASVGFRGTSTQETVTFQLSFSCPTPREGCSATQVITRARAVDQTGSLSEFKEITVNLPDTSTSASRSTAGYWKIE
jgi:hypothetical protein